MKRRRTGHSTVRKRNVKKNQFFILISIQLNVFLQLHDDLVVVFISFWVKETGQP